MPTFRLIQIEQPLRAVKKVFVLEIDGKAAYFDFVARMRKAGKKKELSQFDALLEDLALGYDLPPNACKPLREVSANDDWKEFELKKKDLRSYFFLLPPDGNVIVLGELKKGNKQQLQTIREFRKLKAAYRNHLAQIEEE